ncbi:MAG: hypothetical protein GY714_28835 [Desulfobacterales bacterium]|nr:hypothetical protein [Desulfobacterales bacterium]
MEPVNPAFSTFSILLPLIVMTVIMTLPLIFLCRQLAKEKGKDLLQYTILGCIPFVNYYVLFYLIGTSNRNLDEKLDRILAIIDRKPPTLNK